MESENHADIIKGENALFILTVYSVYKESESSNSLISRGCVLSYVEKKIR